MSIRRGNIKSIVVNAILSTQGGGNSVWGGITGDINNQTDLQSQLSDYALMNYTLTSISSGVTISSTYAKSVIVYSGSTNINITITNLPDGFNCYVLRLGTGQITFISDGGPVLITSSGLSTDAGQNKLNKIISLLGSDVFIQNSSAGSGGTWGSITGTITDQTDLVDLVTGDSRTVVADLTGTTKIPITSSINDATTGDQIVNRLPTFVEYTSDATLVLGDGLKSIRLNRSTAIVATIPPHSSVALPVNVFIPFMQTGIGMASLAAGSGVTITSTRGNLEFPGRYQVVWAYQLTQDNWIFYNGAPPVHIPFCIAAGTTTNVLMGAHPNSEQDLSQPTKGSDCRIRYDATYARRVWLVCAVDVASASTNDPRIYISYSTNNGTNWNTIGAGTSASGDAISVFTGSVGAVKTTNKITIPDAAKGEFLFRVSQNGGNSSASPAINNVHIIFEVG